MTNKGDVKTIWDFEALDTGNKHQQLSKYAATKHFAPLLDTKLRNGIGHASAHYDPLTDEVVCVKADGAKLKEWRISYTRFCYEVVEVMSNLFFAEQYLFDLLGLTKDLLPSRKKSKAAKVVVVAAQPMPASGIKHVRIYGGRVTPLDGSRDYFATTLLSIDMLGRFQPCATH